MSYIYHVPSCLLVVNGLGTKETKETILALVDVILHRVKNDFQFSFIFWV